MLTELNQNLDMVEVPGSNPGAPTTKTKTYDFPSSKVSKLSSKSSGQQVPTCRGFARKHDGLAAHE